MTETFQVRHFKVLVLRLIIHYLLQNARLIHNWQLLWSAEHSSVSKCCLLSSV